MKQKCSAGVRMCEAHSSLPGEAKELYTSRVKNILETFLELTRGEKDKNKKGYTSFPIHKSTEEPRQAGKGLQSGRIL